MSKSELKNEIEFLKSRVEENKYTDEILMSGDDVRDLITILEKVNNAEDEDFTDIEVEECLDIELDMALKEIKEDKEKLDIDKVISLLERASQQMKGENKVAHIFNEDECGRDEIYCMMYICPNCAHDAVLEYDKFCSKCGSKIIWEL